MKALHTCRNSTLGAAMAGAMAVTAPAAQPVEETPDALQIAAPVMQAPLPVLVELAAGWVAADLGRSLPDALPRVAFADDVTMAALRAVAEGHPDSAAAHAPGLVALYDTRSGTIFLPLGWTGRSAAEVSILVHEIVHHFQDLAGERFACPAERERLAYAVQARWLEAHGETLKDTFGITPMFLLVATNCMF